MAARARRRRHPCGRARWRPKRPRRQRVSDPRELRAAVIGLGKLGLLHAATFNVLPGCRLVAVVDKTKTVLDGLKSRMEGISAYNDHQRMLDETRPDLVAIATPTG